MRVHRTVILTLAAVASLGTALAAQGGVSLLVTPQELARGLRDPKLVLLQVGPKEDYDAGHIPGARFVEMSDFSAPNSPDAPKLELPGDADLRARLERMGISNDSRIVVIPGLDWGSPATRLVWTLEAAGLGARTRLLRGGSGGWRRAGLAVTTDAPSATAGHLTLAVDRSHVADYAWVQSRIGTKGFHLIDAREPMFFEGPGMTDPRGGRHEAGHIAGAHSIPFNTLFNDSLEFLSPDSLRRVFANAGVQPGDTVVAYCHIGQQATMVLFGARLLGYPTKLYDGSMDDWGRRKGPLVNEHPGAPPASR